MKPVGQQAIKVPRVNVKLLCQSLFHAHQRGIAVPDDLAANLVEKSLRWREIQGQFNFSKQGR